MSPITQHSKLRLKEERGELGSAHPLPAIRINRQKEKVFFKRQKLNTGE